MAAKIQLQQASRDVYWAEPRGQTETETGNTVAGNGPSVILIFGWSGGFQLVELAHMMRGVETEGPRPPTAIIFDSLPGQMELFGAFAAILAPVKSKLLKYASFLPFAFVYYIINLWSFLTRAEPMFDRLRNSLNDERLLPWTTKRTPRLYLFSDTDKLVEHAHVLEHIAEAKGIGLNVKAVEFKGTPHVAHARRDPETYWKAVEDVWAEAVRVCKIQT
ncbi:hypothetical protein HWV62_13641 [Athelia sp. TMB]|nr:hypothetical protein HWV62_13641 [Athelia sp. TMB]